MWSLNLLAKLIVFHRRIPLSLAIAVIAEAILNWTLAEQVPSLHRVAPRYLKLVTSSNFWPFMLISALMLLVLFVMILLISGRRRRRFNAFALRNASPFLRPNSW